MIPGEDVRVDVAGRVIEVGPPGDRSGRGWGGLVGVGAGVGHPNGGNHRKARDVTALWCRLTHRRVWLDDGPGCLWCIRCGRAR